MDIVAIAVMAFCWLNETQGKASCQLPVASSLELDFPATTPMHKPYTYSQ